MVRGRLGKFQKWKIPNSRGNRRIILEIRDFSLEQSIPIRTYSSEQYSGSIKVCFHKFI